MLVPNLNRDQAPKSVKPLRDKTPHSNYYKIEKVDDRKVLSTRTKSQTFDLGDREKMKSHKI